MSVTLADLDDPEYRLKGGPLMLRRVVKAAQALDAPLPPGVRLRQMTSGVYTARDQRAAVVVAMRAVGAQQLTIPRTRYGARCST